MKKSTPIFINLLQRRIGILILIILALNFGSGLYAQDKMNVRSNTAHQSDESEFVPDEIIVQFTASVAEQIKSASKRNSTITGLQQIDELNSKFGIKSIEQAIRFVDSPKTNLPLAEKYGLTRIFVLKLRQGSDIQKIAEEYENNPEVVFAEPNFIDRLTTVPDDPTYPSQWGLKNTGQAISYTSTVVGTPGADINIEPAWTLHTGDNSVVLAIIDTGLDYLHPEFVGRVVPGYDVYNNDNDPMDDGNHGTACAGIAAGSGNNGIGVAGVNWNCKIMPVKIFPASGGTATVNVANGIIWAADNGADVLSCSFGGSSPSNVRLNAVNYAYDLGCTIIASRGNSDNNVANYPASYPNVIAVGALSPCNERKTTTTCDGETWWGSSYGNDLDVMAPGTCIHTTDITGTSGYSAGDYYASFNGTSAACPFVAGVAALICSYSPDLSNAEIADVLRITAVDIASPGFDDQTGYGRVDAFAALNFAANADRPIISVSASTVSFSIFPDENDNETITLSNILGTEGLPLYWNISYNSVSNPWLTLNVSSGRTLSGGSDPVQINVNSFGMSEGNFTCTLDINSNDPVNPVVQVVVELEVLYNPPPVAVVTPPEMWFALSLGQNSGKTVSVSNEASPGDRNLHWSASVHGPNLTWISLNTTSGVTAPGTSATIQVSVNTAGIPYGVYQDTIVINSSDPDNAVLRIPVQLTVSIPLVTGGKILICVSGTTAFGGSQPDVKAIDLDGSNMISLFNGHQSPLTGAVDNINHKFYWIDGNSVFRGDLDGFNKEIFLPGLQGPYSLAIDGLNSHIYFIETYPDRRIRRANLDGTGLITLLGISGQNANGLSLDIANGKMYWCEGYNSPDPSGIWRSNLDGTSPEKIVTAADGPFGLALDLVHGKIYWGESYPLGIIKKANFDGTSIENVVGTDDISSLAIDVNGGKIYWSDWGWDGSTYIPFIARSNLDGSIKETLLISPSLLFPRIALDLNTQVNCPSELTVNHPGDEPDANPGDGICATADGYCTLRAAVMEANALTACPTIEINFIITGSITLLTALPDLTHPNLSINGPGAGELTVQRSTSGGTPDFRIFTIPGGKTVAISGLTITNGTGLYGGGIQTAGVLSLDNMLITGNHADLSGGGGIWNTGQLTIDHTIFSDNTAGTDAGIVTAFGSLTISNSIFSGNIAVGQTSVFKNQDGEVTMTNCSVFGNSSAGIISVATAGKTASVTITNCTMSGSSLLAIDNGGGNSSQINLKNTVLYNATLYKAGTNGLIVSLGNNLSNSNGEGFLTGPGDVLDKNPMFVSATDLHLQACSPAINAGSNTGAPATDLDGNSRPFNPYSFGSAVVDMGAYEYSSPVDFCNTCEVVAIAGSLSKNPDSDGVCVGLNVYATLIAGSGGNGVDSLAYRTRTGSSTWSGWTNYTSGANISTTGKTAVEIHTLRKSYCVNSDHAMVSWIVEQTSMAGTLTKSPDQAIVCKGENVSAMLIAGVGGNGVDEQEYRTNDGSGWTGWVDYTPATNISTSGLSQVEIRTRRMSDYCEPSAYSTVSWITQALPVAQAGTDATIAENETYLLQNVSAENYSSLEWSTSGNGTFDDATSLNTVYTPGNLDISAGQAELCLEAIPESPCSVSYSDCMLLTIMRRPTLVITSPADQDLLYSNPSMMIGTAGDADNDLNLVEVNVNGGGWLTATGNASWTSNLDLSIGVNTIEARAKDDYGLYSATEEIEVTLSGQVISIPQGWSAISSYLTPNNPALETLLQEVNIPGSLTIMLGKNGIFWPEHGVNTIGNWNVFEGYKVKYQNAVELTIYGDQLNDNSVTLGAGFQIIPVLSNVPSPISAIFTNPVSDVKYIFDIDNGLIYWPLGGVTTLTTLIPGKGYIANFNRSVAMNFPDYSALKAGIMSDNTKPLMNGPWALDHCGDVHFIAISSEAVNKLENASFIGAFDSFGNCIGYTQVDGRGENYLLSVFGNDAFTDAKDGAEEAELISFRSYNSSTQTETELIAEFNTSFPNADGLYVSGGQSGIINFKASSTGIGGAGSVVSVDIYPNPAKDVVNIITKGFQTLEGFGTLMTAEGRLVKTFVLTGNQTQLNVQDLQPGIYMMKIETAENVVIKRLVIQ